MPGPSRRRRVRARRHEDVGHERRDGRGIVALAARTDEGITCFIVEKEAGPVVRGNLRVEEHRQARLQGHRDRRDDLRRSPGARRLGARRPRRRPRPRSAADPRRRSNSAGSTSPLVRVAWVGRRSRPPFATSQQRETFGVPIAAHQAIQFKLADMATKLEAARLLTRSAAEKFDSGERADVEAGMAKLFASESAFEIATESMRIHGGYGYTTELPGRALLPRRPADDHRRGHQRDPATGHRPRAPEALRGLSEV